MPDTTQASFSDLIPDSSGSPTSSSLSFDDLVPDSNRNTAGGLSFDDLVPNNFLTPETDKAVSQTIPPFKEIMHTAGQSAIDTVKGFIHGLIPKTDLLSMAELAFPPLMIQDEVYRQGKGVVDTIKQVHVADQTPPFSKERFDAGFNVLAQMGMLALGAKGGEANASRIRSTAEIPEPEVRPPVGEKAPLRPEGETARARTGAQSLPSSAGEGTAVAAAPQETSHGIEPQSIVSDLPEGGARAATLEQRPIEAPPPGDAIGWEEATKHGEDWLDRGGDINKVVTDFRKTAKVGTWDMGKMRAYLQRLQAVTNQAGDALRKSPDDPKLQKAYNQAVAGEQTFTEAYKPMHTVASNTLRSLQGAVPLDNDMAASYTGLSRRFGEFQGKAMTPEDVVKADRIAKQNAKVNGDYRSANGEVYKQLDNEYGRIRTTRKGPPTMKDLGEIFGRELTEVCDV